MSEDIVGKSSVKLDDATVGSGGKHKVMLKRAEDLICYVRNYKEGGGIVILNILKHIFLFGQLSSLLKHFYFLKVLKKKT